jgi:hypothetical protein
MTMVVVVVVVVVAKQCMRNQCKKNYNWTISVHTRIAMSLNSNNNNNIIDATNTIIDLTTSAYGVVGQTATLGGAEPASMPFDLTSSSLKHPGVEGTLWVLIMCFLLMVVIEFRTIVRARIV